jgi:hypothetical protein
VIEYSKFSEAPKGIGPLKPAPAHSGFSFHDGLNVCLRRGIHRPTISGHSHKKQKADPEESALCQQELLTD